VELCSSLRATVPVSSKRRRPFRDGDRVHQKLQLVEKPVREQPAHGRGGARHADVAVDRVLHRLHPRHMVIDDGCRVVPQLAVGSLVGLPFLFDHVTAPATSR
jgi:hypothetical protein